jgi:hypothetical protein
MCKYGDWSCGTNKFEDNTYFEQRAQDLEKEQRDEQQKLVEVVSLHVVEVVVVVAGVEPAVVQGQYELDGFVVEQMDGGQIVAFKKRFSQLRLK